MDAIKKKMVKLTTETDEATRRADKFDAVAVKEARQIDRQPVVDRQISSGRKKDRQGKIYRQIASSRQKNSHSG